MSILLYVIVILLLLQLAFIVTNILTIPKIKKEINDAAFTETISVLIPARNEERNIQACLESVLNQSFKPQEIVVLDDQSEDKTNAIIQSLIDEGNTIRMLEGKDLQKDWKGKNFACKQLADHASGDWLLFLDADVRLKKDAIKQLLPQLKKQKAGIVSGFPKQIVKSKLEKLLVPMMMFVIYCHLPIKLVQTSKNKAFSAAHGGFIAIKKSSYHKIGGHAAIKAEMVDDMALMKRVKQYGLPATLLKIDPFVYMRMYFSSKEVWTGYQKNIFAGINHNVVLFIMLSLFYMMLYFLPIITLFTYIYNLEIVILSFFAIILAMLSKGIIDRAHGLPFYYGGTIALSILCLVSLGCSAIIKHYRKSGFEWKGRRYH
ncbi:glycosyltransferase [Saliterribacillus persicus]|uniref:4,4'-diaponeurosporenoate glycosyltransferase n=1 Tax=Saliterribacillus persicus TaxID=930114 RepID=A0A368XZ43_9BACI|nr:glycosyltransferase family 2 protein [Saliterribacillus persicus]RCW73135.1 cellulose synthase/poly-beta-1,6-N-acetylglucosamine synthase-like glycosyltransferase [Saliterribacillus persicus]